MTQNIIRDNLLVSPVKPPAPVRPEDKPSDFSRVIAKQKQAAEPEGRASIEPPKSGKLKPESGKPSSEDDGELSDKLEEELLEDQLFLGELAIPAAGIEYLDKQINGQVEVKPELSLEIGLLGQKARMQHMGLLGKEDGKPKPEPNFSTIALNPLNEVNISTKTDLPIAAKVSSPEWGEALAGRISLLVNQRINSAKIHLTPPELGPIEVRVNLNNEQASVQFISHSASVRDALEQAMPRLREMLEASGFTLAEGHVGQEGREGSQSRSGGEETADHPLPLADPSVHQELSIGLIDDYA